MRQQICILGSTGSIGTQALEVLALHPDRFCVRALAAGRGALTLEAQVRKWRPQVAVLSHPPEGYRPPELPGVTWLLGVPAEEALPGCDIALNALVGFAGFSASMRAAGMGIRLCLANKESLVAGGELLMAKIAACGGELLPVDSEHSAIFQCLQGSAQRPEKLILTASGGPFRRSSLQEMENATSEQALRHPNWAMGPRITIDSASMMNKALEMIEAAHLFGVSEGQIEVLIHPTSVIHSMVRYPDGAVLAQLGRADMRVPILYAFTHPQRLATGVESLDFLSCAPLEFEEPDAARFPALGLAREALRAGGVCGAVLNAADEVAVEAFLQDRISFGAIVRIVAEALQRVPRKAKPGLEDILEADREAREYARVLVKELGG